MRKRLQQFRRKIRDDQISSYKENIRINLIEAVHKDEKIEHLNKQLSTYVERQDTEGFFEKFMSADRTILKNIEKSLVFSSYRLFIGKLDIFKNTIILRDLIEIYASFLLSEASLSDCHAALFWRIHRLVDDAIIKLTSCDNQARQSQLDNYLAILSCFYAPKHHKYLKKLITEQGRQLALNSVIPWATELSQSITYLRLLSNVMSNPLLTAFWSQRMADEALVMRLGNNLASEDSKIVCWSLITLNNVLHNWQTFSEACLQSLMPNYLEVISRVYPLAQTENCFKNIDFKKQHLLDSLIILQKLVRAVYELQYKRVSIGHLMRKYNTFRLFSLINQIEYFPDRCLLYALLQFTICVAMDLQNDDQAMSFIAGQLQGTLILGLGNKFSNHITLNALHSIQRLVRFESPTYNQKEAILGFENMGIENILEYLQFNKNHEVASIALSLLEDVFGGRQHWA